jgi:hypothetical protein
VADGERLSQLSNMDDSRLLEKVPCREGDGVVGGLERIEDDLRDFPRIGLAGVDGTGREFALAVPSPFSSFSSALPWELSSFEEALKVSSSSERCDEKDLDFGRRYHSSGTTRRSLLWIPKCSSVVDTFADGSSLCGATT